MELKLRAITNADTANIIKWRNHPDVRKHFIFQEEMTPAIHEKWLQDHVNTKRAAQFIICVGEEGREIGSIYIRDIDLHHRRGELGIFIGDGESRGKGYGSVAVRLLVRYAFTELQLNKVFLRVFKENIGAIRSYEKSGFHVDGCLREDVCIDGVYHDMVIMSILRSEATSLL